MENVKNNKGFGGIALLLILAGALVVGGGAYYLKTKNNGSFSSTVKSVDVANSKFVLAYGTPPGDITVITSNATQFKKGNDNGVFADVVVGAKISTKGHYDSQAKELKATEVKVNPNVATTITKNYKNAEAGYSMDYPSSWYVDHDESAKTFANFSIKNNIDAVLSESGFALKQNGSWISISATYEINYATIDDFTKDGKKYGLPKDEIQRRLNNISLMNIGGKSLRVLKLDNPDKTNDGYSFIYNNKSYQINFMSGSQSQHILGSKVFTDLMASFKFLDAENSVGPISTNTTINEKSLAYVVGQEEKNGDIYLTFDYVVEAPCHNYNPNHNPCSIIQNDNSKLRTYKISQSAIINTNDVYYQQGQEPSAYEKIKAMVKDSHNYYWGGPNTGLTNVFNVEVKNGEVIKLYAEHMIDG